MFWTFLSFVIAYHTIVICGAYSSELLAFEDYELLEVETVGDYFNIRRCQSVEFPVSNYRTIQLNDYILFHCSCFGGQYAPICPQWIFTDGESYVDVEEAEIDVSPNFCKTSLVLAANSRILGSAHNVTARCVIPYTNWNIPDFTFKVEGSKIGYSYWIKHHPYFTYATLCWMGIFILLIVHKSFCRSQKKKFQLFAIPDIKPSFTKPGENVEPLEKSFKDSYYTVLIKTKEKDANEHEEKPLLDNTKAKEIM